ERRAEGVARLRAHGTGSYAGHERRSRIAGYGRVGSANTPGVFFVCDTVTIVVLCRDATFGNWDDLVFAWSPTGSLRVARLRAGHARTDTCGRRIGGVARLDITWHTRAVWSVFVG